MKFLNKRGSRGQLLDSLYNNPSCTSVESDQSDQAFSAAGIFPRKLDQDWMTIPWTIYVLSPEFLPKKQL